MILRLLNPQSPKRKGAQDNETIQNRIGRGLAHNVRRLAPWNLFRHLPSQSAIGAGQIPQWDRDCRKRGAIVTPQDMAFKRWQNTTIEQRHMHALRMNRARKRRLTAKQRRDIARIAGLASAERRRRLREAQEPE